jgi:hypothetical protein
MAPLLGAMLLVLLDVSFVGVETHGADPLANGETITARDLERALGAKLRQLEQQVYDLKRQRLEALIAEKLLAQKAARRGIAVAALLDTEVTTKVGLVTEQEVEALYQANKTRMPGEEAAVREQLRARL